MTSGSPSSVSASLASFMPARSRARKAADSGRQTAPQAALTNLEITPTIPAAGQDRLIYTAVFEAFFVEIKVAFFAALMVSFPIIANQLWQFVAPGLYAHEKRLALPLVVSSTLLFLAGMLFCYFLVFGGVFQFIAKFAPKSITVAPDIEAYLTTIGGSGTHVTREAMLRYVMEDSRKHRHSGDLTSAAEDKAVRAITLMAALHQRILDRADLAAAVRRDLPGRGPAQWGRKKGRSSP